MMSRIINNFDNIYRLITKVDLRLGMMQIVVSDFNFDTKVYSKRSAALLIMHKSRQFRGEVDAITGIP